MPRQESFEREKVLKQEDEGCDKEGSAQSGQRAKDCASAISTRLVKEGDLPQWKSIIQTFKNLPMQSKIAINRDLGFQLRMNDLQGTEPLIELLKPSPIGHQNSQSSLERRHVRTPLSNVRSVK